MVTAHGKRFVDEGADFRNLTYARYGREVLAQPRQFAWQIFDAQATGLLRDEYRIRQVTKVTADTLEELARKLDGVDPDGFLDTVKRYNEAVQVAIPFNPNVKDGRGTEGITPQKSNWANRIDTPPFEAYMITCGITLTFGGLAIDARTANVLAEEGIRSLACSPAVSLSAGCSTSTTRAEPGSPPARCSAVSPARRPPGTEPDMAVAAMPVPRTIVGVGLNYLPHAADLAAPTARTSSRSTSLARWTRSRSPPTRTAPAPARPR